MREFHWGRIPEAANDAEIDPGREIESAQTFEALYQAIRRIPVWENYWALDERESAESVIKKIERIRSKEKTRDWTKLGPPKRRVDAFTTLSVPKQHRLKQKVRELLIAELSAEGRTAEASVSRPTVSLQGADAPPVPERGGKLRLSETVNGVEVIANWDPEGYYVIHFPGIAIDSDAAKNSRVHSNMIVVGEEEEKIREVFEKAKSWLAAVGDPYLIYPLLERFAKGL